jgi:hypothetical protein
MYPHLTKLSTLMIKTTSRNGFGKSACLIIQILNLVADLKAVVNTQRNRWISHQSNAEIQNKAWINKNYFLKLYHPSRNSYSKSFHLPYLSLSWDFADEKTVNKNNFLKLDHPSRNSYSQSFFSKLLLYWDFADEKTANKKYFLKLDHPSRNSYSQSFLQLTFALQRFCWWKDCE